MNRLPNWLRWLLFLPISIIASIVVYLLVKLLSSFFESFFLFQFLLILPGAGLTGYIFAGVAAKLVPKYNLTFSVLMALTYAIFVIIFLTNKAIAIKTLRLTSFEIICLIVVGSIGAAVACYHTYGYQKRIASELDNLVGEGQDNLSSKKIGENDEVSKIKSEALEKQVFHIISEFDSGTVEGGIKHTTKERPGSRFPSADESSEIYQDDSLTPNVKEDVIIADATQSDLEKEVLGVVSILDSNIGESARKPSSPVNQQKRSTGSTKSVDSIYPAESSRQKVREVAHIPGNESSFSESEALQSGSKLASTLKQPNGKETIDDELLVKTDEPNVVSEPVQSETLNQEIKQDNAIPQSDVKVTDNQTSRTSVLDSENKLYKRKPAPKVNRLIRTVKSSNSGDASLNDLPEQRSRGEQHIGRNDQRRTEPEPWQKALGLVPEIIEPKNEIIIEDDLFIGLTETDESTDALLEELFDQELQPEKHVSNEAFEDTKQEELEPPVESEPEIIESKREVKFENNQSIGSTDLKKSSDAFTEDFSEQEWQKEKHVLDADSMDLTGGTVQRPFKSMPEIVESRSATISSDRESAETNQVVESYEEEVFPQEFDTDDVITKPDSRELPDRIKKTELNLPPEENRPRQTNEDDLLIGLDEIDELINRYQDDSFLKEFTKNKNIQTPQKEESAASSFESNKIFDSDQEDSLLRKFVEENNIAFLDLKHSERELLQTTTELYFLITESKKNQFTKFIQEFFISKDNDQKLALINTEIFYLWCMMVTIFDFSIDSDFRKKLIQFFNSRTISLYLKWKEFTKSGTNHKKSIDFNNFTYYSNQLRTNRIHLNSSFQNTEGEILFGKIVLAKILENMGNRKINLDRNAILMPVQAYYELKQRVIEILNNSTETICI